MNSRHVKLPLDALARIDDACVAFEQAWQQGRRPSIESIITACDNANERSSLLAELVVLEFDYRSKSGEAPTHAEYIERFPQDEPIIATALKPISQSLVPPAVTQNKGSSGTAPKLGRLDSTGDDVRLDLGRYVVLEKLGVGGFATVYRAYDQSLQRDVAVKVPHAHRSQDYDLDRYLSEARLVAKLDHPAIVPVYDAGTTEQGTCYVVSRLVKGQDLAHALREWRPSMDDAVAITLRVAEAVSYAHRRGLIHRDLKPSNILLDLARTAYVTDFGLALESDNPSGCEGLIGTPAYMSPEQAASESHLIDHRTDIFSLGVIFYELLTGQRPFAGSNTSGILASIREGSLVSPKRRNSSVPLALDQVCMRALMPRISDRFSSAQEFHQALNAASETSTTVSSPSDALIVPKGLRSFDEKDASFYLQLLPGPFDATGLPESIRFWTERMSNSPSFRVGLLSGPSGVGKSSLVKAGLIPRLPRRVNSVFVEANADNIDDTLLEAVTRSMPLSRRDSLVATFQSLRRDTSTDRLVIFIDQAEQWLNREKEELQSLVAALRQCDGEHLQAVIMVRDEFAMEATRLLHELDVAVEQGVNFAVVSGLPKGHAQQVLMRFGQALEQFPDDMNSVTAEQKRFVDAAIEGLAKKGRVAPVQLAMLTEILRNRSWTSEALTDIRDSRAMGLAYLEMSFGEDLTHPECRLHRHAARRVLAALLPDEDTNLKGHYRTRTELITASGYSQGDHFDGLLRLLDRELRLITPAEVPADIDKSQKEEAVFLLAHDFIVAPLREWLTQKDKETRRGRAEQCLAERSRWWSQSRANRQLPTAIEWLSILIYGRSRVWSSREKAMMRRASAHHITRCGVVLALVLFIGFVARMSNVERTARNLASSLVRSNTEELPAQVGAILKGPPATLTHLENQLDSGSLSELQELHVLVGLEALGVSTGDRIIESLITTDAKSFYSACRALGGRGLDLADRLKTHAEESTDLQTRFRVACGLAQLAPAKIEVVEEAPELVEHLLAQSFLEILVWARILSPLSTQIAPVLESHFNSDADPRARQLATNILGELFQHDAIRLIDLAKRSTAEQLASLMPLLRANRDEVLPLLQAEWKEQFHRPPPRHPRIELQTEDAIEEFGGALQDTHAYVASADRRALETLDNKLEHAGYKSGWRTSYKLGDAERFATIWQKQSNAPSLLGGPIEQEQSALATVATQENLRQVLYLFAGGTTNPFRNSFVATDVRYFAAGNEHSRLFDVYWPRVTFARSNEEEPCIGCRGGSGQIDFPTIPFHTFDAFTLEAWIGNWSGGVLAQGRQGGSRPAIWFGVGDGSNDSGTIGWSDKRGKVVCRLSIGRSRLVGWHHFAVVFDGASATCFLDGKAVGTADCESPVEMPALSGSPRSFHGARLGFAATKSSSQNADGLLRKLRLSRVARYTDAFEPPKHLPFDDETALYINVEERDMQLLPYPKLQDRLADVSSEDQLLRRARHVFLNGYGTEVHNALSREMGKQGFRPVWHTCNSHGSKLDRWQSRWTFATYPPLQRSVLRRLASVATMLADLGDLELIAPGFALRGDNDLRSELIYRFAATNCAPVAIQRHLAVERDPGVLQGLMLAISEYSVHAIPQRRRQEIIDLLMPHYVEDGNPGVHSAIELLARRWEIELPELKFTNMLDDNRQWYMVHNDHLMAKIDTPVPLPTAPFEREQYAASFAIDMRPVSTKQFWTCYPEIGSAQSFRSLRRPATSLTWHEAAGYCNWLSKRSGLHADELCFEQLDRSGLRFRPAKDYLKRKGFRLPTRAEWQYACGGGARTNHFHGNSVARLSDYCWDVSESNLQAQDMGMKYPNWAGLFDIAGNVSEWVVYNSGPWDKNVAVACGGNRADAWGDQFITTARPYDRNAREYAVGFRVARTIK